MNDKVLFKKDRTERTERMSQRQAKNNLNCNGLFFNGFISTKKLTFFISVSLRVTIYLYICSYNTDWIDRKTDRYIDRNIFSKKEILID